MKPVIFTTFIAKSNKYPARIKTHAGGVPVNYVYNEKYSMSENHILSAQNFSKYKEYMDEIIGVKKSDHEYIFILKNASFEVHVDDFFYEDQEIITKEVA